MEISNLEVSYINNQITPTDTLILKAFPTAICDYSKCATGNNSSTQKFWFSWFCSSWRSEKAFFISLDALFYAATVLNRQIYDPFGKQIGGNFIEVLIYNGAKIVE